MQELGPESPQKAIYPAGLSAREVDVLRLLVGGRSNQEIGSELFITANTVANHVKNILGKTGASNRTEAAAFAVRNDLG
jgi:DNA-binding NarL/FixJ family response regulator